MNNVCIAVNSQKEYMELQRMFFRAGITWGDNCELVFDDHSDVTHIVVIDGVLYNNYTDDGDPVVDGFKLITWEEIR